MKKVYVKYVDSNRIDDQTDEIAHIVVIEAIGFVLWENLERLTIAREIMDTKYGKEYRGQIAIPKKAILEVKEIK